MPHRRAAPAGKDKKRSGVTMRRSHFTAQRRPAPRSDACAQRQAVACDRAAVRRPAAPTNSTQAKRAARSRAGEAVRAVELRAVQCNRRAPSLCEREAQRTETGARQHRRTQAMARFSAGSMPDENRRIKALDDGSMPSARASQRRNVPR
jgi:hypothetical protein